ncbi:hypothetical protein NF867_00700 [Solitalea sp. MAHUQ-68]|uniref:Uncharacterized protein n=1 Tax=Solitalea agri TaxID=2953739 RepID=A0A9X2EZP3_9SPHI|nr:hypothetical protein [Solitalea agri]MCO4291379.1 hypothetical protein [Solitalea agri]
MEECINDKLIVKYKTPYKTSEGKVEYKSEYVINWLSHPINDGFTKTEDNVSEKFKEHNKSIDDWSVKLKIKNTFDFIQFVKNKAPINN